MKFEYINVALLTPGQRKKLAEFNEQINALNNGKTIRDANDQLALAAIYLKQPENIQVLLKETGCCEGLRGQLHKEIQAIAAQQPALQKPKKDSTENP